jgi:hypothetical protein
MAGCLYQEITHERISIELGGENNSTRINSGAIKSSLPNEIQD